MSTKIPIAMKAVYKMVLEKNWKLKQFWYHKLKGRFTGRYTFYLIGPTKDFDEELAKYTNNWKVKITLPLDESLMNHLYVCGNNNGH